MPARLRRHALQQRLRHRRPRGRGGRQDRPHHPDRRTAHSKYVAAYITKKVSLHRTGRGHGGRVRVEALRGGRCRARLTARGEGEGLEAAGESVSAVTENIRLKGPPGGRLSFLGEAGCGNRSLVVHLWRSPGRGERYTFDLDQTKPPMRSRDAQELLGRARASPSTLSGRSPTRPHRCCTSCRRAARAGQKRYPGCRRRRRGRAPDRRIQPSA